MTDYKAIIFDLDGTAIPNTRDGMPSERLIKAVAQAKANDIYIIAATGRTLSQAQPVLQALNLQDPCVICGGTLIIDPATSKTIHEASLSQAQLDAIRAILMPYPYMIGLDDKPDRHSAAERQLSGAGNIVFVIDVESHNLTGIIQKLSDIPGVLATSTRSWTVGRHVIHITTRNGSKEHGIDYVLKMLGVSKKETIGVGDGDNDIHLFAAVGHRIAMGNASEQLKSVADEIAPSIDEDGLAWVIDRYS